MVDVDKKFINVERVHYSPYCGRGTVVKEMDHNSCYDMINNWKVCQLWVPVYEDEYGMKTVLHEKLCCSNAGPNDFIRDI